MRFDLLTIFPEFFRGPLDHGVVARAARDGRIHVAVHDLRAFAPDPHRTTDDRPFGGGEGMVMKLEPIRDCLAEILPGPQRVAARVVLLSASGRRFTQAAARRLAQGERLVLICGRYEGVDERVAAHLADEELSLGDFVLSGGELAALAVLDAVARLLPGILGDELSALNESFAAAGVLDFPQYTRPAEVSGWRVPDVLLGGNHAAIAAWRRRAALAKTKRLRPDLLAAAPLTDEDRAWLASLDDSAADDNQG